MCIAPLDSLYALFRIRDNVVTKVHGSPIGACAPIIEPAADVACIMAVTSGKWIAVLCYVRSLLGRYRAECSV